MRGKAVVVDRGVDEVLITDDGIINITNLSGKKLIELLNKYLLTDVKSVSYDEYVLSNEYPKANI